MNEDEKSKNCEFCGVSELTARAEGDEPIICKDCKDLIHMSNQYSLDVLASFNPDPIVHEYEVNESNMKVLTRKDIYDRLNKGVTGQEEAKQLLSTLGDMYNRRCQAITCGIKPENVPRMNIFITGPTGFGKTFILKHLAKALDIPFVRVDCSSLSQEGWSGVSLQECLDRSQLFRDDLGFGIIMLDELDKLCSGPASTNSDSPHVNIQQNLLDLLDGEFSMKKEIHNEIVNNCLILCAGSFESVRQAKKMKKKSIGFNNTAHEEEFKCWKTEMQKAGMIPEITGRIIDVVELERLEKPEIRELILKENSVYKQYQFLNPSFKLDKEAIDSIVDIVYDSKYGLRELETCIFRKLYKHMYTPKAEQNEPER